jgi:hypothetical protein
MTFNFDFFEQAMTLEKLKQELEKVALNAGIDVVCISNKGIDDVMVEELCKLPPHVKCLILSGNDITEEGVMKLLRHTAFVSLELDNNNVDFESLKKLIDNEPSLSLAHIENFFLNNTLPDNKGSGDVLALIQEKINADKNAVQEVQKSTATTVNGQNKPVDLKSQNPESPTKEKTPISLIR